MPIINPSLENPFAVPTTRNASYRVMEMIQAVGNYQARTIEREIFHAMSHFLIHNPEMTMMQAIEAGEIRHEALPDNSGHKSSLLLKGKCYLAWTTKLATIHKGPGEAEYRYFQEFDLHYAKPDFKPWSS